MANKINPPKKHKYPTAAANQNKNKGVISKRFAVITAIILAAIMVLAILIVALVNVFYVKTPYNDIRITKYIRIGDYNNITLSKSELDKALEDEILEFRKNYSTKSAVSGRSIQKGDNVTVDILGYLLDQNGNRSKEPLSSVSLQQYEITDLGSHYTANGKLFMKEIQDALIGVSVTGTVTLPITYPETHVVESLRNKTVSIDILVKKVTETIIPEYNDAFVKDKTGIESASTFEQYLTKEIEYSHAWTKFVNLCVIRKYPSKKMEAVQKEFVDYYNAMAEEKKVTFEKLLSETLFMTQKEFDTEKTVFSEGTVKEELVLYYLVKKERLKFNDKEYEKQAAILAEEYGYKTAKEFEEAYGKDIVRRTIYWEKAKDFILSRVTITE